MLGRFPTEAGAPTVLRITCAFASPFHSAPEPASGLFSCICTPIAEPASNSIGLGIRIKDKAAPTAPAEDLDCNFSSPREIPRGSHMTGITKSLGQS